MSLKSIIEDNGAKVKKLKKIVKKIDTYADTFKKMSDEELRHQTTVLKSRYNDGESLDSLLPEAFATIREADKRVLGLFPYEVQLMGGIVLHQGNLAEMRTGEGKTLTETMPVYLNALTGLGVHVITVNEYLSQRDAEEMGPVFKWMGLSVGINGSKLSPEEKQKAYDCDITYSTNEELAFDYLRDNQEFSLQNEVQRGLNYAIVDEVDSILIDEARTPLIISGEDKSVKGLFVRAAKFAKILKPEDYKEDVESKTVSLNSSGVKKANKFFGLTRPTTILDKNDFTIAHYINEAIKAEYTMQKDKDYVVQDGQVVIVDNNTGRTKPDSRYSDGLHQALEAKEGVEIKEANKTQASITYQNYFRMYKKLSGMTGTAKTDAKEFYETYHMKTITIPTHRPVQRIDLPDVIFATKKAKFDASVDLIKEVHAEGEPILVGTGSVEDSEYLSELLDLENLPHSVLNAKNNAKEADIVAQAGQLGAITIATNMAGRGTDIKLGPGVAERGGLYVLGTEKFESRRIDDQLRGRSGRQGDPGVSVFYLSLQDELIERYGSSNVKKARDRIISQGYDGSPLKTYKVLQGYLENSILRSQKRIEGNNFEERKSTLKYDDVLRTERERIYSERQKVLRLDQLDKCNSYLFGIFGRTINRKVDEFIHIGKKGIEDYDLNGLYDFLKIDFGLYSLEDREVLKEYLNNNDRMGIKNWLMDYVQKVYQSKVNGLVNSENLLSAEKIAILQAVDVNWRNNIDLMEQLRMSITLRGYGQYNSLIEYQKEASQMYKNMISHIEEDVTRNFITLRINK